MQLYFLTILTGKVRKCTFCNACSMFSFCIAQNIVSDFFVSRFFIKFYVKPQQLSSFLNQRPNSWTQLGQKLLFSVTSTNGFYPPPPIKKWFETDFQCKHYAKKPQRNCMFMNSASEISAVKRYDKISVQ
jgi:hypothetical protein